MDDGDLIGEEMKRKNLKNIVEKGSEKNVVNIEDERMKSNILESNDRRMEGEIIEMEINKEEVGNKIIDVIGKVERNMKSDGKLSIEERKRNDMMDSKKLKEKDRIGLRKKRKEIGKKEIEEKLKSRKEKEKR